MRVAMVGGVAGGTSVATRLRRLDSDAETLVLERSGHVRSTDFRVPLFVGGLIETQDALLPQNPVTRYGRFRLNGGRRTWLHSPASLQSHSTTQ